MTQAELRSASAATRREEAAILLVIDDPSALFALRTVLSDLATDPGDAAIVRAIISLAHVLDLTVVAEGVENEAQLAFLVQQGCDELQGHLFSRALPGD